MEKLTFDEQLHSNGNYRIVDSEGWHIAWVKDKEHGGEIVDAVNNHEQLVKTLQEAKIQIEEYQKMTYTVNKPFKGLLASINVSLSQLESK